MSLIKALPINETKLKVMFEIYAEGEDYLRNIEKKTKINPSLVHRTLKNLLKAGIISKKERGKENYYCLTYEGKSLFIKFLEIFHLEKAAERTKDLGIFLKLLINNKDLFAVCQRIYLFGSFVLGDATKHSDIDVLFVTSERKKVVAWCHETSLIIGREINPLIYTPNKFRSELKKKEYLLDSVVNNIKNRVIVK